MEDIPTLAVPLTTTHTHTVVFLHGRGDNVKNFTLSLNYSTDSQGRTLRDAFPSFKWVFPEAPIRTCASSPGDKIRQWFDIWNVSNFREKEDHQAAGLVQSVTAMRRILADEAAALGGRWDRIVLAGISQGAATSVHTLLNLDIPDHPGSARRLAAFIGFSCRMPFPGRTLAETRNVLSLKDSPDGNEVIKNTPMLLEHCIDDPLVLVALGRALRDSLRGFGAQVEWVEYPDGGHWFNSPAGINDVVKFLNHYLFGSGAGSHTEGNTDASAMDLS